MNAYRGRSLLSTIGLMMAVGVYLVDTVVADENESLLDAYERCRAVYESTSCCDYSLRVAVTRWSDQVKQDMSRLVDDKGTIAVRHTH